MPAWSMDDWAYVERQVVTDPRGRRWSIGLMDLLGQEGDPEMPSRLLETQYDSGRYYTIIYSPSGSIQYERGYRTLAEATDAYGRLLIDVVDGRLDPAQPVFRADLDD